MTLHLETSRRCAELVAEHGVDHTIANAGWLFAEKR
jgi:hypothetical protein